MATIRDNDIVEIIDALSDILYVAYGLGAVFGINLDETFRIMYKSKFFKDNYDVLSKYPVIKNTNYHMVFNEFYLKISSEDNHLLSNWKTHLTDNPFHTVEKLKQYYNIYSQSLAVNLMGRKSNNKIIYTT